VAGRDRILLVAGWLIVLAVAAGEWAGPPIVGKPPSAYLTRWADLVRDLSFSPVLAIAALPLLWWIGKTLLGRARGIAGAKQVVQGEWVACGLMLLFAAGQLARLEAPPHLYDESGFLAARVELTAAQAACLTSGLLLLLWSFVGRSQIDTPELILRVGWITAFVAARMALATGLQRIDVGQASLFGRAYIVLLVSLLLLLILIPLASLIPGSSRMLARIGGGLVKIPSAAYLIPAFLAGAATLANQWPARDAYRAELVARGSAVLLILSATVLAWTLARRPAAFPPRQQVSIGRAPYLVTLALITGLYLLASVRIATLQMDDFGYDGVAYLQIARRYAMGELALRGHWSPLLPWLLAPGIASGLSPEQAARGLGAASGLILAAAALAVGKQVGLTRQARLGLAAVTLVTALAYAFSPIGPDVLAAGLALLFLLVISRPDLGSHPVLYGVLAGTLGALSYYAKYYNLAFVVVMIGAGLLWPLVSRGPRRRLPAFGVAAVTVVILVLPWAWLLGTRYGRPTISTSGPVNHARVGPGSDWQSRCLYDRPCLRPSDVLFPWEDPRPEDYAALGWNPLQDAATFRHQVAISYDALLRLTGAVGFAFGPVLPLGMVGLALAVIAAWSRGPLPRAVIALPLAMLVYPLGYVAVHGVEPRYYLPVILIAAIAAFLGIDWLLQGILHSGRPARRWPVLLAVTLAALLPALDVIQMDKVSVELTRPYGQCLRTSAAALAPHLAPPWIGSFKATSFLAYFTSTRTLGVLPEGTAAAEADRTLRQLGVRTYVVGAESQLAESLIEAFEYRQAARVDICGEEKSVLYLSPR